MPSTWRHTEIFVVFFVEMSKREEAIVSKFNRSEFDHLDDETFHATALEIARQLRIKHARETNQQVSHNSHSSLKTNKNFLKSVIKNTQSHNQSLSQKPQSRSQTPAPTEKRDKLLRDVAPRPIPNVSIQKDHLSLVQSSAGQFLSSSFHHLFESSRRRSNDCVRLDLPPNCPW